jgi:hypothetical protein
MNQSIHNPECKKYFIATDDSVYSYGVVEPNMYMDSGLPNIETFTDETIYLDRLYELGLIEKYFIAQVDDVYSYGLVTEDTSLDTEGIEIFIDEDLYLNRLDELGLDLEDDK